MISVNESSSVAKISTGVASPLSEPVYDPLRSPGPQIALRSDGSLLLSVEDIPPHVSLEGRERWTAVVLRGAEAELFRSRLAEADADAAARIVVMVSRPPQS